MPTVSLKDFRDRAVTLTESFTTVQESLSDALQSGNVTSAQLRYLEATLTGIADGVRGLRADMDPVRVEDETIYEDGANTIALWRWERGLRHAMTKFELSVRDALEITSHIDRGQDEQVYVSRSGDTLQRIAQSTLGDWREWPRLLEANPDLGPGNLPSGTVLTIPKKR